MNEVFTQPVESNLGWKETFGQAQFSEFVNDSRVQLALKGWEKELAELRGQVSRFLADLSSATI